MGDRETLVFKYRFEIFFATLLLVLFGSLFFPFGLYAEYVEPCLFLLNILAGVKLLKDYPKIHTISWFIFGLALISTFSEQFFSETLGGDIASKVRLFMYYFFYAVVTVQLILQVWDSKEIKARGMMALMSGYICLGLLGFFIFLTIDVFDPGAIGGLENSERYTDDMMYFSYITLLTIGYGDISPVSPIAKSASVFLGMLGQFYMVILVAVVIDKFKTTRKNAKDLMNS